MVCAVAEVAIRRDGAVLWITLDRPEALNALNAPMFAGLAVALEEAADPEVRAVVLTGAGRGFCAGQDVTELQRPDLRDRRPDPRAAEHEPCSRSAACEKPVIAAVNGPAAGAGLSLALACDVRVASDAAVFAPAFPRLGLAPDAGATWLAARLLGAGRAFEWLTTGRELSAAQALEWGLVSEVVARRRASRRARPRWRSSSRRCRRGPSGRRSACSTWRRRRRSSSSSRARRSRRRELVKTDDFAEGLAAFLERRPPAFTGRGEADPSGAARRHRRPAPLAADRALRWAARAPAPRRARRVVARRALVWSLLWVLALIRGQAPPGCTPGSRGSCATTRTSAPTPTSSPTRSRLPRLARRLSGRRRHRPAGAAAALVGRAAADPRHPRAASSSTCSSSCSSSSGCIGWFAALAIGRMPRGMRDLMAYCLRYQAQTSAYLVLLTSRYPSLAERQRPPVRGGMTMSEAVAR